MSRIALIGAGNHCRSSHAPALVDLRRRRPGEIRVAVCDHQERLAVEACDDFGFEEHFTDVGEMRARFRPDAAMLIVPAPALLPVVRDFVP